MLGILAKVDAIERISRSSQGLEWKAEDNWDQLWERHKFIWWLYVQSQPWKAW